MNPLMANPQSDDDIDPDIQSELIKGKQTRLLNYAIAGRWDMVELLYQEESSVRRAKLGSSEDTVLHMAVSESRGDVVTKLLGSVRDDDDMKEILELRNAKGDTPLHLAAARGMVETCELMTEKHPDLIKFRNHAGENPLFVAAFHGTKDAFKLLHNKWRSTILGARQASGHDDLDTVRSGHDFTAAGSEFVRHFRRHDDKTILHCTISREYFDLAIQIIQLHPFLTKCRDQRGYFPLHYLAEKPLAFRSGTSLGVVDTIIYNCVWFDPLENKDSRKLDGCRAPDNYKTCLDFFLLVVQPFVLFVSRIKCMFQSATGDMHKKNLQSGSSVYEESGPSTSLEIRSNTDDQHATVTPFEWLKYYIWLLLKHLFIIIGGERVWRIRRIRRMKHKHLMALQITKKLLIYTFDEFATIEVDTGDHPLPELTMEIVRESPLLIAAREGVKEMIFEILNQLPQAIYEKFDGKNIVLIAVENRQANVFEFLLSRKNRMEDAFAEVDSEGNTALHLAATHSSHRPQHMPGELMKMHWEIKWYEYVRDSMPESFVDHCNRWGEKPWEVFLHTQRDHIQKAEGGGEWMNKLSQSCSVVASLIATVAYASATTFPGGNDSQGNPNFRGHPAFSTFIISAFAALCFSLVSLVMFLTILFTGSPEFESSKSLPEKLLIGLTSLFISMGSMLVSFCAGHFFFLKKKMKLIALPIYVVGCMPIILIVMSQFPLYWSMLLSVYGRKPRPCYRVMSL